MRYTPTEALKVLKGINRKKLYNLMNDGTVSYLAEDNRRILEGAELARVFGDKYFPDGVPPEEPTTDSTSKKTLETSLHNQMLQQKIEMLENQLADKNSVIEDLRNEREEWKNQAKTLLLRNEGEPKRGFISKVFKGN